MQFPYFVLPFITVSCPTKRNALNQNWDKHGYVDLCKVDILVRVYVTWLILYMLPPSQLSIGFPLLLFAWTVTEMIRYSMTAVTACVTA